MTVHVQAAPGLVRDSDTDARSSRLLVELPDELGAGALQLGRNKRRQRFAARMLALVFDMAAIVSAFLTASFVWLGDPFHVHALNLLSVVIPIYVVAATNSGAYALDSAISPASGAFRADMSLIFTICAIGLIIFFLRLGTDFSRAVFFIGSSIAFVAIPIGRIVLRRPLSAMLKGSSRATLVIVDGTTYRSVSETEIIVTPAQLGFDPETSDPLSFHRFAESVSDLDRIVVSCVEERQAVWSSALKGLGLSGEILIDNNDPIGIIGLGAHGDYRTIVVAAGPLHFRQRALKRAMDLVLSGVALVILAPLLVGIALAIKLESQGPALFRQKRIGRHNRLFNLYKFRSMFADRCDADAAQLTRRSDPRVTRIGEFIRRTSIDELPQLLNVLKGEMSLVGPRPHAISAKAADLLYWDVDPRYRHRHSIKPGLTGLAQVRGFRGATDRTEDLVNRLTSDLEYAVNWSMVGDLRIIFRTLRVLRHDNAF